MKTLFPPTYNYGIYLLSALIVRLIFFDMDMFSYVAIIISIYQFSLLFRSISYIIPTRHLLGSFMCVQFFVGPTFAYNGLDRLQYFKYQMRIPESEYFSYVIPAVICFIIGLHVFAGKYKGEIVNKKSIESFVQKNPKISYIFIGVGFAASIFSNFFSNELSFVFYLLGSFKFVGLFLLLLGSQHIKLLSLILVIGSIISSSLGSGMFHDLLTWLIFSASVVGIKYKFGFKTKLIGLSAFIFIALTIQVLKSSYREATGRQGLEGGVETFGNLYQERSDEGGFLNTNSLAQANVRINQGFIITNIMTTVPGRVPFSEGAEMYQILEAAIMPRILAPNKLKAGDRDIFVKYSGIPVAPGTSMGLSSVGDAYINFGVFGGIIFMFLLGLFYNQVLKYFYTQSKYFPVLILFVPLVFYYPIRPDCELQTILGHVVKSCFIIFVILQLWKVKFSNNPRLRMLSKSFQLKPGN